MVAITKRCTSTKMNKWGVQIGLFEGDPILLGKNGLSTMRTDQAARFATELEATEEFAHLPGLSRAE